MLKYITTTLLLFFIFQLSFASLDSCSTPNADMRIEGGYIFCAGESITLINNTYDPMGLIDCYIWKFGNGDEIKVLDTLPITYTYLFDNEDCNNIQEFFIVLFAINNCSPDPPSNNGSTVYITPPPLAQFDVINTYVSCFPDTIFEFTNESCPLADTTMTFFWSFGDGNTSTLASPSYAYSEAGMYQVQLTSTNSCGISTITKQVEIKEPPQAAISSSNGNTLNDTTCANESYLLSNSSLFYDSISWSIFFEDIPNPIFTSDDSLGFEFIFPECGDYRLQIEAISFFCGIDTFTKNINVVKPPILVLDFDIQACGDTILNPSAFPYFNLLGCQVDEIIWDLGDQGIHSGLNIGDFLFHTSTPISVTAYNVCDTVTAFGNIEIVPLESAEILHPDTLRMCSTDTPISLNTNSPIGFWEGNISTNGLFDPSTTLGINPIFYGSPCLHPDTIIIIVEDTETTIFGDQLFCLNETAYTFSTNRSGGTFTIDNGTIDATTGLFIPDQVGVFTINYTWQHPEGLCETLVSHDIEVIDLNVSFLIDSCAGNTIYFDTINTSSYSEIFWDFGDDSPLSPSSNPIHTYDNPDIYTVSVTIEQGHCSNTATQDITIEEPPFSFFTLSETAGCSPLDIIITNQSTGDNLIYIWDFGNGETSDLEIPTNPIFTADGLDTFYIISLTTKNGCGSDTFTDTVFTLTPPFAIMNTQYNEYCSGEEVTMGSGSYGQPNFFEWSLNSSPFSNMENPAPLILTTEDSIRFDTIQLIVSNGCASDTTSKIIQINPTTFNACFNTSPQVVCLGEEICFENCSTFGLPFELHLGDGNIISQQNFCHAYTTSGVYDVELFVYGCGYSTTTSQVEVLQAPQVTLNHDPLSCENTSINFILDANTPDHIIYYGDGDSSVLNNAYHQYDSAGIYSIQAIATSSNGCTYTVNSSIEIKENPIATFVTIDSVCPKADILFESNSVGSQTCAWNFGDQNITDGCITNHSYDSSGNYIISLVATDTFGCRDTTHQLLTVRETPEANFEYEIINSCSPVEILTYNNSSNFTSAQWIFGDGGTSTLINPIYTFQEGGIFDIALITTADGICFDSTKQQIQINETPSANISINDITCFGAANGSIRIEGSENLHSIVFNDSFYQSGINLYEGLLPADYNVQIINDAGCDSIYSVSLTEPQAFWVNILKDTITIISGQEVLIETNKNDSTARFIWEQLNQLDTTQNIFHPVASPTQSTLYTLTAINENGCLAKDSILIRVVKDREVYIPNLFTPNGDGINDQFFILTGSTVEKIQSFEIHHRWGGMIYGAYNFSPNDISKAWDGRFKNRLLNDGIFVYKFKVKFADGEVETFMGTITLIK